VSVGGSHYAPPETHRAEKGLVFGHELLDNALQALKPSADDLPLSGTVTGLLTPMTKKRRRRAGVIHDPVQCVIEE
jgi:hypothetical protein